MFKTLILILFFILVLFFENAFSGEKTVRSWRYFPELNKYKIMQLSKISPEHVLALTKKGMLLEWKERDWKEFEPQPPQYAGGNLIALAPDNIWRFYLEHLSIYCTKCLHFDGSGWREVKLTQPYSLGTFDFIDSTRFWAGGGWGSLIYYDGRHSQNISAPVCDGITWIKAFSADSAFVLMNTTEKPNLDKPEPNR